MILCILYSNWITKYDTTALVAIINPIKEEIQFKLRKEEEMYDIAVKPVMIPKWSAFLE